MKYTDSINILESKIMEWELKIKNLNNDFKHLNNSLILRNRINNAKQAIAELRKKNY